MTQLDIQIERTFDGIELLQENGDQDAFGNPLHDAIQIKWADLDRIIRRLRAFRDSSPQDVTQR